jgi:predicted nucleotidyltransferase
MRLSINDIENIKNTAKDVFGNSVRVILFGSRVNDNEKGGDIDLLIEAPENTALLDKKLWFLVDLERKIGTRKVDVVLRNANAAKIDTIKQEALRTGIVLL